MADQFDEVVNLVKESCECLLAAPKHTVRTLPKDMPKAGVYLFSEAGRPLYVGRAKTLRKRLQNHTHNSHNQATFAFLLARHETGNLKASYQPRGSRKDLLTDPEFRAAFDAARERVRHMDVQFVEEADPIRQAILEVYAALETRAEYNDFDTH